LKVFVSRWVLQIELNGEWEECQFLSRNEALSAFVALARDYKKDIKRAILLPEAALRSGPAPGYAAPELLN
jgi:hypothetical protein